ncbi:hypothetical protein ES319_D07G047100v1 [Gossypium barbadense]|uniref:Integrase catalytic domain-containing protein n=2 Tax=Gossypium TaxID=3633 RepID=A0A5J5QP66_GOSBA|nr:hypothetical protein ES319_D07G047100v1 [Gossypium barbadense]TYG60212.1 hypothetical protein ES288_D07G050100v1 [Gossypium darwinii]
MPDSIVSDRDKVFISNFWQDLFQRAGARLHLTTAYHPETDGQTEVLNRCLESYLTCMSGERPQDWVKWLPLAEWWYNSTFHTASIQQVSLNDHIPTLLMAT